MHGERPRPRDREENTITSNLTYQRTERPRIGTASNQAKGGTREQL